MDAASGFYSFRSQGISIKLTPESVDPVRFQAFLTVPSLEEIVR